MPNLSPRAVMQAFYTTINDSFQAGIANGNTKFLHQDLVRDVSSDSTYNLYSWTDFIPNLREIRDNQQFLYRNIQTKDFQVRNREFELHLSVARNHVVDNQFGHYEDMARGIGIKASRLRDMLSAELINGGFDTTLTFDGQPWFGTHTVGLSTFTNRLSLPLNETNFKLAVTQIKSLKVKPDAESFEEPIIMAPKLLLVVAPKNEFVAEQILKAATVTQGGVNILYNKADLLVDNWLTNEDDWFLFITDEAIKPIYFQDREKPMLHEENPETSDVAYTQRLYKYGVFVRGAALPTFPWLALGSRPGSSSSSSSGS